MTGGHDCPAPGCIRRMPAHLLACPTHWYAIPRELRTRLNREYHENFGERSYFEARALCLQALGVPADEIKAENGGIGAPK